MNRKLTAVFLTTVMVFSIAACALASPAEAAVEREGVPKVIRWGSATVGGAGYVIITAFSDTISKYIKDFRSSSMATSGGSENVILLRDRTIDFGQLTSSDFVKAKLGEAPYNEPVIIYQGIGYRTNANIIHVLKKSGITSVEQLDGKKVAVGAASGSGRRMVQPGLLALGIKPEFVYGSWDECSEMLKSEQVAAVVYPIPGASMPTSAVLQLSSTTEIAVVPLTGEQAQQMCDAAQGVSVVDVPADYLGTGSPAFFAQGYHNSLGVRPEVNEDVVYTVIKTLLEHEEELHGVAKDLALFSRENAFKYMLPEIPVHPGAARYYKEAGIWDDRFKVGD